MLGILDISCFFFLLQDEEISSGESCSEQNERLPTPQLRKLVTASDLEVWVTLRMSIKDDVMVYHVIPRDFNSMLIEIIEGKERSIAVLSG